MSSELQSILARVERSDPAAAKELRRHIDLLAKGREFGLHFERHTPERVGLPGLPFAVGDKVMFVAPRGQARVESKDAWIVESFDGAGVDRIAHLHHPETGEKAERSVEDLVFAADFRDPIYPGLASVDRIERGDGPFHAVINGENYHVLDALRYTHAGAVDLVYIDPPYNTGNEGWIYNDRYVAAEDGDKHSKWLAFMERRLKVARRLLKDTGVIIVAIGDDEHHRLRMLMDQVFGDHNFISDVVWQGGRKNDSRYVSNGADYMLVYAKDEPKLAAAGIMWRDRKQGVDDALAAARASWEASNGDAAEATKKFRAWIRAHRTELTDGVARYNSIDSAGRVYFAGDLRKPSPTPNSRYELLHPVTGQPVKMHPNGWVYVRETMDALIAEDRILFGVDHTTTAYYKRYLQEQTEETVSSVFERDRRASTGHLNGILGDKRFPNPKDHEVLMRWIRLAAPKDAVVLDFFGGSGTTAEAVMRLNVEDGGTRQCILVTNNELAAKDAKALAKAGFRDGDPEWEAKGVFEHVTRPRLSTVVTGTRPDGSTYSDGLEANVEFFNLTYENPALVEMDLAFERVAPLLWLKAGGEGQRIDAPGDDFAIADTYAVLFTPDATASFLKALRGVEGVRVVYVVTDDEPQFQAVGRQLPDGVESVRLYSSYLHTFKINTGAAGE